jgi:hypothetical protein
MRTMLIVPMALVLALPMGALAASTNFSKAKTEYEPQKPDGTSSRRDVSTGLPTGKRMHKPYTSSSKNRKPKRAKFDAFTVTKTIDTSSPSLMRSTTPPMTPHSRLLSSPTGGSFTSKPLHR